MNCIPVRTAQSIENFARIGSVFLQEYKGSSGGEFKTVGVKQKKTKRGQICFLVFAGGALYGLFMLRSARVVIANQPHHIIQRGHNHQVVCAQDEDYVYYSDTLAEWKEKLGCKVYAYCLMTNHVHLVIDPGKDSANLALLMKRLARRYTRYIKNNNLIKPQNFTEPHGTV
jgi:REP element-mobilizing transposase RayT